MNSTDVIVEVLPGSINEKEGTFTNDKGEEVKYATRKQSARLESNGFAYPYDVRLEKDQPAFQPGRYRLALERMLQVNKGAHGVSKFPVLVPVTAPAAAAK